MPHPVQRGNLPGCGEMSGVRLAGAGIHSFPRIPAPRSTPCGSSGRNPRKNPVIRRSCSTAPSVIWSSSASSWTPASCFRPNTPTPAVPRRCSGTISPNCTGNASRQSPSEPEDLVIDIGSNDGNLLMNFKDRHRVLGVTPEEIGKIAIERGIPTLIDYFTPQVASRILSEQGPAKVVTATNVFAHIDGIHEVLDAILRLLSEDGVFRIGVPLPAGSRPGPAVRHRVP